MQATGIRGEQVIAWTIVVVVHAMLAMLLLRLPGPPAGKLDAAPALDVVWIPAPRSLPAPQSHVADHTLERRSPPKQSHQIPAPKAVETASVEALEQEGGQSMSAVFLEQARLPDSGAENASVSDPFARRTARLPGRNARTFRMRPPPSLAERVAAVGRMFGGGDDPCHSMRDSINELSQAGDSRELQDALDYEKQFCR